MVGAINAQLTVHYSKNAVLAAAISFTVGAIGLGVVVLVIGIPFPTLTENILWWHWTGGILGAYFVFTLVYLSHRVGASMVIALVLAGQVLAAVVLDHFGWAGYPERTVTGLRLIGITCMASGALLIKRS